MKYVGTAAACGLLASSSLAQAELPEIPGTFSGNIGFASDYVWQGISLNAGDMAIQGGFDWDSGQGWYASVWGSSVDFYGEDQEKYWFAYEENQNCVGAGFPAWKLCGQYVVSDDDAKVELDFYVGYWGYIGGGYNTPYDVGVAYYAYPGAQHDDNRYCVDTTTFNPALYPWIYPACYETIGTGNYAELYAGIGHYFFDDRVKTMAYLNFTNDYNGQNQDAWYLYADTEVYLPYQITGRFHVGYTWGQYWRENLFTYNTNSFSSPGIAVVGDTSAGRIWGWCGLTWAAGPNYANKGVTSQAQTLAAVSAKGTSRYASCYNSSGDDSNFYDWSVGLQRSFGNFDVTLDYVWVTGMENEDIVESWWAGMDRSGANEIYTEGKLVGSIKMAL